MRLLNGMKMFGHSLEIKPFEKTHLLIREFYELKKQEIMTNRSDIITERQIDEEVHNFLSADDEKVKGKIQKLLENFDIEEFRMKEERENDKKEMKRERERERERKRNQIKKDMEKRFQEKLKSWIRNEEEIGKRRKRELEKERDVLKEKKRAVDKELEVDSEDEGGVKIKTAANLKHKEQRRKLRQKELEEDEIERKKEIMEKIAPPSMDDIMPKDMEDFGKEGKILQLGEKLHSNADFFLENMKYDDGTNPPPRPAPDTAIPEENLPRNPLHPDQHYQPPLRTPNDPK
jgi:hypothetical protein